MLPASLRETFTVKNAVSNGIWTIIYALVYAAIAAVVPVILHATTSLSGVWLGVAGFALFCSLCAATLAIWAYRSSNAPALAVTQQQPAPHQDRHQGLPEAKAPDLCKERLSRLAQGANHLGNELPNFDNWWPAVQNKAFDGRLGDNHRTTHAEAMEALLYAFAQFFSAAWVYQDKCRIHEDRAEVIEWIEGVYGALGKDPGPDPDVALNSKQLRLIGQRSTARLGEADAQPLPQSEFEDAMYKDDDLAAALKPLEEFLFAAAPNSPALARVEAADKAVANVKERLRAKGHCR